MHKKCYTKTSFFFFFFGLIISIFSGFLFASSRWQTKDYIDIKGEVVDVVEEGLELPYIRYQYCFNDVCYLSQRKILSSKDMKIGDEIQLQINPASPSEVKSIKKEFFLIVFLWLGLVLLIFNIHVPLYIGRKKKKKDKKS